jgi:hypothetical protein
MTPEKVIDEGEEHEPPRFAGLSFSLSLTVASGVEAMELMPNRGPDWSKGLRLI